MPTIQQGSRIDSLDSGTAFIDRHANSNVPADIAPAAASAVRAAIPLPPAPKRWVARRKAEVVDAVRSGVLSLDEACAHYALTIEEFLTWKRGVELYGLSGLRVNGPRPRRDVGPPLTRRQVKETRQLYLELRPMDDLRR